MTMTTPNHASNAVERNERIYRRLLIAYPPAFRHEYGEDLVQSFRDLMVFSTDGRGVWRRTVRDLVTSATKERGSMFSGGQKPSRGVIFVIVAAIVAALIVGSGMLPWILVPTVVLIGLPIFGISRFHRAWVVRRTTGAAVSAQIGLGIVSFAPAMVILALLGEDAGYFVFVAVGLALIVGSALGIIWAVMSMVVSGRERTGGRRWVKPALVLVPSIAVLGFIIGASYNSYRQSLGPAGDHSVENASADTRALWDAADEGDVDQVVMLTTETCADPWVKFPVGNGRHNAKGQAEARELDVGDELEPPFREISDMLGDYMDIWGDRCGQPD